ncbi:UPF0489 family protein [Tritonibacter scottomollicae]|uniref:UPF0489 family protein n=1 Tax=Tritonibacter scottomollicae TaxID=483013 RepID=UPI003BA9F063
MHCASEIPVVIVEEHREALTALAWGREVAVLPPSPMHFYNVDHHADLDLPRLVKPIPPGLANLQEIRGFVDSSISISAFIWLGAYLGFIDHVSWLPPKSALDGKRIQWGTAKNLFIATLDTSRTTFITAGVREETDHLGNTDRKTLRIETVGHPTAPASRDISFNQKHASAPRSAPAKPWVLSIDLDYFSCNSQPHNPFRLNVDKATFLEVSSNPNHPLRCSVYHHVEAVFDDDGYAILFDQFPEMENDPLHRTEAQIADALAELRTILSHQETPPQMIIIARSRLSGFTPKDQWEHIEKNVLAMLKTLFPCRYHHGETLWS